jgi:hypothetical protein
MAKTTTRKKKQKNKKEKLEAMAVSIPQNTHMLYIVVCAF